MLLASDQGRLPFKVTSCEWEKLAQLQQQAEYWGSRRKQD
jgi:hypothetical protein